MITTSSWESPDKAVRKNVLKQGIFSKKLTEHGNCVVLIENVTGLPVEELREKFHSEILNGVAEKTLTIGEAKCEIDRQIERAIQMMFIHEKSLVTVNMPSENENEPVAVKCEITLKSCTPYKPIWEWTPEEKYQVALNYKEFGVSLFKDSRFVDAFHMFSRACKIIITLEPVQDLELEESLEKKLRDLRLVLYNNLAGCHLNRKNYEHTVSLCNKVLEKDKNNVKALYRRGVAYGNLKDVEKAAADLKAAITLEPNNRAAKEQYLLYNQKVQEANQKFEDMVKRMFKN